MSKRILLTTISVLVVLLLSLAIVAPASADQSVTVTVLDSQGNAIPSVTVQFSQNNFSTYVSTTTNGAGVATKDLADGTWKVRALYHNTSAIQTLDTNDSNSLTFYTSQSEARVYKHDGTPFPDVLVRFSPSSGFGVYVSANTDSTGLATAELFPATVYLRASVSGTSADQSMALAGDSTSYGQSSLVTFYTSESRVVVQNCSGSPKIEGARAQFFHDGTHGTYVSVYTDANGVASTELFPGSHDVQASMNFTAEIKTYTLAGDGKTAGQSTTTTFNPTKVAFAYNGPIHIWTGSYWATFTNPSYMFSATVKFRFGGGGGYEVDVPISGCEMEKTAVTIKLLDSGSHGLDGGIAQYNLGGWQTAGTTNSDGEVFVLIDGLQNTLAFRMYWEDTYIQKNQNVSVDSTVVFQTVLVKMELHSSSGAQLEGEGQVNSGAWKTLGNTPTAGKELLPKTYAFRIYYEDTYIQKNQNVDDGNTLVVFDTVLVKMELHSSLGAQLTGEGQVNSGSWKTLGDTPTAGKELLPKTYAFRIYYEDTYIQKNQNVADDPLVVFETVRVQMELHSSSGAQLTGEGQVNSGNWKTMGLTPTASNDGGKELLPKTYAFRIYYEDTYIQKNQNVDDGNTLVVFDTVLVKMELHSSLGAQLTGEGQVNSGSWKTLGDTPTAGKELLPKTYAFRIYYEDTYIQKNQNVADDPLVVFETVRVQMELHSSSGAQLTGEGQVNSGNWKTMGLTPTASNDGGKELLPKTYAFRIYYEDTYIQKNQNVSDGNNLVVFDTVLVTMKLLDADNNELAAGAQVNSGSWKTFGDGTTTTTMELLPKTYAFRVYYEDTYIQMNQNVGADPIVIFRGTAVTIQFTGNIQYNSGGWKTFTKPTMTLLPKTYAFRFSAPGYPTVQKNIQITGSEMQLSIAYIMLLNSAGNPIAGGEGQYNVGGWQSAGNSNSQGVALAVIDGLQNTLAFRMYYEDTYIQKNQNIANDSFVIFQTVLVKMELHSSLGAQLTGEGQVNSGSWKSLGNTPTAGKELLPKTYAFRIYYEDTYIEKSQNVGNDPLVVFDTVLVKMELHSSQGTQLTGEGQVDSGSWKSLGNTPTAGMELLPKTYAFRIYYEDTYIQKNQNVASDPLVVFETVLVKMELHSSSGGQLTGEGQVNSGTWKSLGNTPTAGMELLPATYAFRIYYEDTYIQKNQNVASDPLVIFETVLVKMELHSSSGAMLTGEGQVNSGTWKSLGNTPTAGMELLPATYAFRIYYEDTYIQENQNVASDQLVVFNTVLVTVRLVDSGSNDLVGDAQVNSGTWKSLGNTPTDGKELLPTTYAFRVYYDDTYTQKNQNVSGNPEVIFTQ